MRAATGVPSVGVLWSAVASVRSGRRTARPARRSAVEGLRARHLVHEVQVDVEQPAARPRGPPRSCRTASLASSSALLCACAVFLFIGPLTGSAGFRCGGHLAAPQPGGDDRQEGGLRVGWGSRSGVAGRRRRSRSRPPRARGAAPSQTSTTRAALARAPSRGCPARASAGRRRAPVSRAGRERVARELGALAGLGRGEHLEAVPAPRVAAAPALRRRARP